MHKLEAKEKICPILNENCLVDKCMMWKFNTIYDTAIKYGYRNIPMPPLPVGESDKYGNCTLKRL